MKKVLFPFEFNQPCYRESYVYAAKVARNLGAELIMLHAFEVEVDDTITRPKYEEIIKNNWVKAYQEILRFHDYYLNVHARIDPDLRVKVDHRIINGILMDEYRKILHTENIDLVVLPASAGSESTRKMLKLMRREALNRKSVSLLATPHDRAFLAIDHSLFTYGMKRIKDLGNYIGAMTSFARAFDSTIHLVHIPRHAKDRSGAEEEAIRSFQNARFDLQRIRFTQLVDHDSGKQVMDYISTNAIQMVIVPEPLRHALGDLFHESLTELIGGQLGIPLLVLNLGEHPPIK